MIGLKTMQYALLSSLLCLLLPCSGSRAQQPPAWDFIRATQQQTVTALTEDSSRTFDEAAFDIDQSTRSTLRLLSRVPEMHALLSIDQYGAKLVEEWEDPYSAQGIAHVLLCAQFVCPRYNEPDDLSCWRYGIEAAAERLVQRLLTDKEFRRQYRKFLVWSGMPFDRERLIGDLYTGPYQTLYGYFGVLKDHIESADDTTWRHALRCAVLALIIDHAAFFESPLRPKDVKQRFGHLERFFTGHQFAPRADGFGWRPCGKFDPSGTDPHFLGEKKNAVGETLFNSEDFDQAIRFYLIGNAGGGVAAALIYKKMTAAHQETSPK